MADDVLKSQSEKEPEKLWYVVNTYAGQENRVKQYLEKRRQSIDELRDNLFQIIVAEEPVIEIKNGKQVTKNKNMFSGYILVEMKMTQDAWYQVRNTPGVTGFIGSSGKGAKPFPISQQEVDEVLQRMGKAVENIIIDFEIGDLVEIQHGPFEGNTGTVLAIDPEKKVAKVQLVLFGRETPTDIDFNDLKKAEK